MPKPNADKVQLSSWLPKATVKQLKTFAREEEYTIAVALDWCIRDALHAHYQAKADERQLEKDNA